MTPTERDPMLEITLADLLFRYRQFLIAVVGAGVVLAMAVLMSGIADGFTSETHATVGGVGADRWLLNEKSDGRLTAVSTFPEATVDQVAHTPGVTAAQGLVFLPAEVVRIGSRRVGVNLMGVGDGRLGRPSPSKGHGLQQPGDAVVDARAHLSVGTTVMLGSTPFHIVGIVHDRTLSAGTPMMYVPLSDAQRTVFDGQPVVTAVVTTGVPTEAPPGLTLMTPRQIENSTLETLSDGVKSIRSSRLLMWIVATIIVAALIYVSALQRVRDFAVLKALGSSSTALFVSLCLQAVIITLVAAGVGMAASTMMTGIFSQPVTVRANTYLTLPLIAVGVGLVASLVALRRAVGADPAAAFGG